MKKTTLISSVLLILSFSANAQLDTKLNILSLANRKPEIALEAGYDKFSLELINGLIFKKWGEASVYDDEGNYLGDTGYKRFGYNGVLKANYYFSPDETIDGWKLSPYLRYRMTNVDFSDPVKEHRFGAGLMFGRKGLMFDQFGYDLEAGFGYWVFSKAKLRQSGEPFTLEEEFPFFGEIMNSLRKYDIPFRASVFYRIGG